MDQKILRRIEIFTRLNRNTTIDERLEAIKSLQIALTEFEICVHDDEDLLSLVESLYTDLDRHKILLRELKN